MIKIINITILDNFSIKCTFNNGLSKIIHVLPLLETQKHQTGIEKLTIESNFSKARIGIFGEIIWDDIIETKNGSTREIWDYDISPEFVFHNGVSI